MLIDVPSNNRLWQHRALPAIQAKAEEATGLVGVMITAGGIEVGEASYEFLNRM